MAYSSDKKWYAQKLVIQSRGHNIFDFLKKQTKDEAWNTDFGSEPTNNELKTAWENYESKQYQRDRAAEYPSIVDQLDDIYHNGIDGWKATIKVTKDKYPKE